MSPGKDGAVPPEVTFCWGLYKFVGLLESYKETIEFFSHDGVPLRSTLKLSLAQQDTVFDAANAGRKANTGGSQAPSDALPANAPAGKGVTDAATKGGNPSAARDLARANGLENMRFAENEKIDVSPPKKLKGPVGFATSKQFNRSFGKDFGSGGASGATSTGGLNLAGSRSGGASGAQGNLRIGGDVGGAIGISGKASFGTSVGGRASARVSGSSGAFGGLRVRANAAGSGSLKIANFEPPIATGGLSLQGSQSIGLGGAAKLSGSASLKANVGEPGQLASKLEFDGD